ncbi:MAG TPA: hypothetical protein VFF72_03845 [Caldimonas sp.]|nr:hypothetical protein [Caldimonas sp.]
MAANNGGTGQSLPVGHVVMSPIRFLLSSLMPSVPTDTRSRRAESCPPLARPRHRPWPLRLGGRAGRMLAAARLDFADALDDIRNAASLDAKTRIAVTRSLHELWHLREEVFSLVARRHDQSEASRRLARLNRHFLRRGGDSLRPFERS